jgi:hypothetical protein
MDVTLMGANDPIGLQTHANGVSSSSSSSSSSSNNNNKNNNSSTSSEESENGSHCCNQLFRILGQRRRSHGLKNKSHTPESHAQALTSEKIENCHLVGMLSSRVLRRLQSDKRRCGC